VSEEEKNKVVRVEVEYEDGTVKMLTGEDAQKYLSLAINSIIIAEIPSKEFNWVTTNKYPAPA
jgi:hypothetical protein